LKLGWTNDTGANVALAPLPLCINYIQVFADNGQHQLLRLEGIDLWMALRYFSQQEFESLATLMNTSTTYGTTGATVANGSTATYYCPLLELFSASSLHLKGLKGEIMIRVVFHPTARTVITGSLPRVDSCVVLLRGFAMPAAVRAKKHQIYEQQSNLIPFLAPVRMSSVMTLAASTTYSVVLSGIRGLVSDVVWGIRPAAVTASNQASFDSNIDSFDLVDSNGTSLTGHYRHSATECKSILYIEHFHNRFNQNSNFLSFSWAADPADAYRNGHNSGFCAFTSFERLSFTTGSGLTPGDFELIVLARVYSEAKIERGEIRAQAV
jgi:hypothetical protein